MRLLLFLPTHVWAARKKLDGRCDYRKSWETSRNAALANINTGKNMGQPVVLSSALAVRLWVAGKQKLSVVGYKFLQPTKI